MILAFPYVDPSIMCGRVTRGGGGVRELMQTTQRRLAFVLAVLGLAGMVATLAASSSKADDDTMVFRAVAPGLAGDSAEGFSTFATATVKPATPTATPIGLGCAGPRSAIRTLTDGGAGFPRTASNTSLSQLLITPKPDGKPGLTRVSPESSVVRFEAYIISTTNGSGNVVANIANTPGDFQVQAGFPLQNCITDASDADRGAMNGARIALQQACGQPGSGSLGGKVVLEGVPHWREQGGQQVMSIWPVLKFELADGWNCKGVPPTATPTTTPVPDIDVLYLSVDPQFVEVGQSVLVTAMPQPPAPGRSCTFTSFSDAELNSWQDLPGMGTKTTDAEGEASWTVTIPEGAVLGQGRFQVSCGGGSNAVKIIVVD